MNTNEIQRMSKISRRTFGLSLLVSATAGLLGLKLRRPSKTADSATIRLYTGEGELLATVPIDMRSRTTEQGEVVYEGSGSGVVNAGGICDYAIIKLPDRAPLTVQVVASVCPRRDAIVFNNREWLAGTTVHMPEVRISFAEDWESWKQYSPNRALA